MSDMYQAYKVNGKLNAKASNIESLFIRWHNERRETLTPEERNEFTDRMNELQSIVNELRRRVHMVPGE